MFCSFKNQEERRNYGGSEFIEIQLCDMPQRSQIRELVSIDNIRGWRDDSLYVHGDDYEAFFREYSHIFDCGTYNNLQTGVMDLCGINYYAPNLVDLITEKLRKEKPQDYEVLAAWLACAKEHNGFYILGL